MVELSAQQMAGTKGDRTAVHLAARWAVLKAVRSASLQVPWKAVWKAVKRADLSADCTAAGRANCLVVSLVVHWVGRRASMKDTM